MSNHAQYATREGDAALRWCGDRSVLVVNEHLARQTLAADTAVGVADRLSDPAVLPRLTAESAAAAGSRDPWEPLSLTTGYPGVAILHAQTGDLDVAYHHLRAARLTEPGPATTSIFHGYGAFVSAVSVVAQISGDYQQLLTQGERWLAATAVTAVRDQRARRAAGEWLDNRCWNTVRGVTGPGRLLLAAVTAGRTEHLPALQEILAFLIKLAEPRPVRPIRAEMDAGRSPARTRPGWWAPAAAEQRPASGAADLGAAHGISGPLALLSLAGSAGIWMPDQDDAIRRVAEGLLAWRTTEHRWPVAVFQDVLLPAGPHLAGSAWSDGTAGIARALWLAGSAVGDHRMRAEAITALAVISQQPPGRWQLQGPTVRHGYAGLLAVATRIAAESGSAEVARLAETAAALILADLQHDAPWGFRHTRGHDQLGPEVLDIPGLLCGAAGTALALREWADTAIPPKTPPPNPGRAAAGPAWGMPLLID